jgi:hypothetical protein
VYLPFEAPVSTVARGPAPRWPGNDVRAKILRLGVNRPSVAEVAARLSLPLGVARVLIGDLVTDGYMRVHVTLAAASTEDRRELIGRTLRGLRAL